MGASSEEGSSKVSSSHPLSIGVHASTGGQRTVSDRVSLDEIARAAGYRWVERVETVDALAGAMPSAMRRPGPGFVHARITPGLPGPPGPRIPHTPEEMTARMRRALVGAATQRR